MQVETATKLTKTTPEFASDATPDFPSKSKKIVKHSTEIHFPKPKMNSTQVETAKSVIPLALTETDTPEFASVSTPDKKEAKTSDTPEFPSKSEKIVKHSTIMHNSRTPESTMNSTQVETETDDIVIVKPKKKTRRLKIVGVPIVEPIVEPDPGFGVAMPSPEVSNDVCFDDIIDTDEARDRHWDVDELTEFNAVEDIPLMPPQPQDEVPDMADFDDDEEEIKEIQRQRAEWDRKLAEKIALKEKKTLASMAREELPTLRAERLKWKNQTLQGYIRQLEGIQSYIDEAKEEIRLIEEGGMDDELVEKFIHREQEKKEAEERAEERRKAEELKPKAKKSVKAVKPAEPAEKPTEPVVKDAEKPEKAVRKEHSIPIPDGWVPPSKTKSYRNGCVMDYKSGKDSTVPNSISHKNKGRKAFNDVLVDGDKIVLKRDNDLYAFWVDGKFWVFFGDEVNEGGYIEYCYSNLNQVSLFHHKDLMGLKHEPNAWDAYYLERDGEKLVLNNLFKL